MGNDIVETTGEIVQALPNAMFKVRLQNGKEIICHVSGKIRQNFIQIMPGDKVKVQLSTYDLSKGRITFRTKE